VFRAISKETREPLNFLVRAGLQLLMLTAARPGELRAAAWEEIDL
jgi:integrase